MMSYLLVPRRDATCTRTLGTKNLPNKALTVQYNGHRSIVFYRVDTIFKVMKDMDLLTQLDSEVLHCIYPIIRGEECIEKTIAMQ